MAARGASLHHLDLTTHPGAGVLDRFTWSRVLRLNRLEQVKDVLRARRRPKSEEMLIRISEGPTATKRDEARVPDLRADHGRALLLGNGSHLQPYRRSSTRAAFGRRASWPRIPILGMSERPAGRAVQEAALRELIEESGQRPDDLGFAGVARVYAQPTDLSTSRSIRARAQLRLHLLTPLTLNEEMSESMWWNLTEQPANLNPIDAALAALCLWTYASLWRVPLRRRVIVQNDLLNQDTLSCTH